MQNRINQHVSPDPAMKGIITSLLSAVYIVKNIQTETESGLQSPRL